MRHHAAHVLVADVRDHGRLAPGDVVLTTAFGAGLSWGANLVRWTAPAPAPAEGA